MVTYFDVVRIPYNKIIPYQLVHERALHVATNKYILLLKVCYSMIKYKNNKTLIQCTHLVVKRNISLTKTVSL